MPNDTGQAPEAALDDVLAAALNGNGRIIGKLSKVYGRGTPNFRPGACVLLKNRSKRFA